MLTRDKIKELRELEKFSKGIVHLTSGTLKDLLDTVERMDDALKKILAVGDDRNDNIFRKRAKSWAWWQRMVEREAKTARLK
jgi:hypothetical protein